MWSFAGSVVNIAYKPKFKLDYLAGSGIGIGVSSFYGTSLSSGIQGVFSDILGRNQIFAAASVNGQIYDSGAAITYVNQTGRWNLGFGISHIPYQFGVQTQTFPTKSVSGKNATVLSDNIDIIRNFEDAARVFTSYPISKTTRFEVGAGASYNSYRVDRYADYYALDTTVNADKSKTITQNYLTSDKKKIANDDESKLIGTSLKSYSLFNVSTALVGDNSFFGVTAPLNGFRYRLEAEYNFGTYHFFAPTIDLRKYVRVEPVTFAARFYGYGRFGGDATGLYPLYVGYPFYIRGYEGQTFYNNGRAGTNGFTIDQLSGSRIAVFNFEVRLPFTGPEKLAQIKSKFLFTDLNLFFDAGLAWNAGDHIYFQKNPPVIGEKPVLNDDGTPSIVNGQPVTQPVYGRVPALSAGISLRINVFGAFVLEPYLAVPFNRTDVKKPLFGLGFTPGW